MSGGVGYTQVLAILPGDALVSDGDLPRLQPTPALRGINYEPGS